MFNTLKVAFPLRISFPRVLNVLFLVTIANTPSDKSSSSWLNSKYQISIVSDQVKTVIPGKLRRLAADQSTKVLVGVRNANGVARGVSATAKAVLQDASGKTIATSSPFSVTAGIPIYTNTNSSLAQHESPSWYDGAKFGIFVSKCARTLVLALTLKISRFIGVSTPSQVNSTNKTT